jgi:hypothetical protein
MLWSRVSLLIGLMAVVGCATPDVEGVEEPKTVKSPEQIAFFWENLLTLCGRAFEGNLLKSPENAKAFRTEKIVLDMVYCSDTLLQFGLYVGEDRSRVISLYNRVDQLELRHRHYHEDGMQAEESGYGGFTNNQGTHFLQVFPADAYTARLAPAAASNVWWLELDPDKKLVYNLARLGSDREFKIDFNIAQSIASPYKPWNWQSHSGQ